jgi:hypothetical protein
MSISGPAVLAALRSGAMTFLGIVLALVPPALWVAWTETLLLTVVLIGVASAVLLVLLADFGPEEAPPREAPRREVLDEAAVAELHRIFPLTYHHSLVGRARFHRAMHRVLQLIESQGRGR